MSDAALVDLARKAGLEIQWRDVQGREHTVPPETLCKVLAALGLPAESEAQISASAEKLDEDARALPTFFIAWAGETIHHRAGVITAPEQPGYHRIEIAGQERTLAVAPQRCFTLADVSERPLAGVGVQLYSLRGGHTAGFGDYAALCEFTRSAAARGVDAVAVSPTHALFPNRLLHISPYSPSTRTFLNPLYADSGLFGGPVAEDDGKDGLIDWQQVSIAKFAALKGAWEKFRTHGQLEEFRAFCTEGGERMRRHAIFDALETHFRIQNIGDWRIWPPAYRDAASPAVAEFAREHHDEVEYYLFLQFLASQSIAAAQAAARQAGMHVGLIADLATGMDPSGSDAWSAPDNVLIGLEIGAPPDLINNVGQGWGLTALSPTGLQRDGFASFIAMVRANMAHAGGVRIDHAMGLMRLWVIPERAPPTEGVYLRYPMEDLLRLIALESYRNRCIVVGEDLGTVPHGFREHLRQRGISGMQVLWFERDWGGFMPPERWRNDALAMTTTHDLPTVAGWWRGRDIVWRTELAPGVSKCDPATEWRTREDDRRALWNALRNARCVDGDEPPPEYPDEVVTGTLAYVGKTPARLAVAAVEDVLALTEQPNLPGTIDEHPNWRRRLPPGDSFALPGAEHRVETFVRARQQR